MANNLVEYQLYVYNKVTNQRKFASDASAKKYFLTIMQRKNELRGLIKKKRDNGKFLVIDGIRNEEWDPCKDPEEKVF